jgi:hypothetical protein
VFIRTSFVRGKIVGHRSDLRTVGVDGLQWVVKFAFRARLAARRFREIGALEPGILSHHPVPGSGQAAGIHKLRETEIVEAVKKLAPSQVFHNLGQFYGYAYNFGLPGCKERELFDGWGRPIRLSIAGDVVHIWSIGSDGVNQSGEGDDIRVVVHLSK